MLRLVVNECDMNLYLKESVRVGGEVTWARPTLVREREPSIPEVLAWLREQGVLGVDDLIVPV